MIIDCHGHYTTAPESHTEWRQSQLAAFREGRQTPAYPAISDDEIRESIEQNQLRLLRERGADMTIFSPRASAMGHHEGDERVSVEWSRTCNDLIARVVELFPETFIGVCQLPQSPGADLKASVTELERCVVELGFVGCNLSPDPSGGKWTAPPLTDHYWYPIYDKMVELDVPAMVHVSSSANPVFHATGAHYINADTTAFMQFIQGDLFADFPDLRLVIPHGGGAVPYHWGRYRGLADMLKKPPLSEHVMKNVFFDTCVYHQPGIDLLFRVIDSGNIMFGSEMVGAVRGTDPETGHYFDDTRRYVDAAGLSAADAAKVYSGNARRVYPRLDKALRARGLQRTTQERPSMTVIFEPDADWLAYLANPRKPDYVPAPGAVDAHCHVFGPGSVFPYAPERKYTPVDAPKEKLFALRDFLGFERNVIVQATCHGADNRALVDALLAADDRARGVATIRPGVTKSELADMHAAGVRGVRFNFVRRLADPKPDEYYRGLVDLIAEFGWHIVVYFEAADLAERWELFTHLPTVIVVDHIGRPDVTQPVDGPSFALFERLMHEHENVWAKLSGAERLSVCGPPGYEDFIPFARHIAETFPDRVIWGTDWPHPNMKSHMPDEGDLVDLVPRIAPAIDLQRRLLVDNPMRLYWEGT